MIIGSSMVEAIDWVQDHLGSTRPEAERTLFVLLEQREIVETEAGYATDETRDKIIDKMENVNRRATARWKMQKRNGYMHMKRGLMSRQTSVKHQMHPQATLDRVIQNYAGEPNDEEESVDAIS